MKPDRRGWAHLNRRPSRRREDLHKDQVDCSKGQSILSLELLQSGQAVKEEPAQLLPVPPPLPPAFPHHHHLASPQKSVETSIQEAKLSPMKSALR